jgi:predicted transposase YdaD
MQSDKQFFEIFEVNPEWLFELTGRPSPGPCKFVSITLKAIERRADGLLLPEIEDQPISIAEIQMQPDSEVYQRYRD